MVARIAEYVVKPGKTEEICNLIETDTVPLARVLPGFVDKITLVLKKESRYVLVISFWESAEDEERFSKDVHPQIRKILGPLIEAAPSVRTFDLQIGADLFKKKVASSAARPARSAQR